MSCLKYPTNWKWQCEPPNTSPWLIYHSSQWKEFEIFFCQNSYWYWLLCGFTALAVGIKPQRRKGQILQHLNTYKLQWSLEVGVQFPGMCYTRCYCQKTLLKMRDVANQQKPNIPAYNQLDSLEQTAVLKAIRKNKEKDEIKRHYL